MSQKAYLKGQKLYEIHHYLWNADPLNTQISEVAQNFGIWHMGQFAVDYGKIFNKLPFATLKHTKI